MEYLLDAFWDTWKTLPFLFLVYLLLEILEHKLSHHTLNMGRFGPVVGSAVGILPQCGFSVAATTLFNKQAISLGTLLAVYLATSDEAIPILLAHPQQSGTLIRLLAVKFIVGVLAGLLIDLLFQRQPDADCYCTQCHEPPAAPEHHHHHTTSTQAVLWHSARKTLQIALFLVAVLFVLNLLIGLLGEERLESLLLQGSWLQPLVCGLVGLIPTCVPSILITQLFLEGSLSFSSAVAGLCTGAGMGILVLFKENHQPRTIAQVLALLYGCGVCAGLLLQLFGW
ncbi:MAG: putative manganese transporter [Eubacteriales bacterium]|jgi:uncharacterized membrane protein YraQ (UPF0718 family)